MSEFVYFSTLILGAGSVLLIFGMRYYARVQAARAETTRDEVYQRLAAQSAASLSAIEARLAAIEKLLRSVE